MLPNSPNSVVEVSIYIYITHHTSPTLQAQMLQEALERSRLRLIARAPDHALRALELVSVLAASWQAHGTAAGAASAHICLFAGGRKTAGLLRDLHNKPLPVPWSIDCLPFILPRQGLCSVNTFCLNGVL